MTKTKKVLVSALNWGLGHATRCIPVIKELIRQGAEVTIASDGRSLDLLKREFPQNKFITLPGYNIKYSSGFLMPVSIVLQIPKVLNAIRREHQYLETIIKESDFDVIISDNRYGLWSKSAYCIFITHQLMIKCPFFLKWAEPLIYRLNRSLIKKYDACWIPDYGSAPNLSGDLSHSFPLPENAEFIGPLSRMFPLTKHDKKHPYEILIVISGPEPQRSRFETTIFNQLHNISKKTLIVQGKPEENSKVVCINDHIDIVPHLTAKELNEVMNEADVVIARSGYSTVMDIVALNKTGIFIPTPGQTEQEYLCKYLKKQKVFYGGPQKTFNLSKAISESAAYSNSLIRPAKKPDLTNLLSRVLS